METIATKYSEGGRSLPMLPNSSMSSQADEALSKLLAKDPILGEVMKIMLEKLDETNKKVDDTNKKVDEANKKLDRVQDELLDQLETCRDNVNKLDVRVKSIEDYKAATMETIEIVKAKLSEKKSRQLVDKSLGLPMILRRLLEQFSNKELLTLSLVNKLWNFEARSVLRDRGSWKAKLDLISSCRNLTDFASDLRQMRIVPFTGISVNTFYCNSNCESLAKGSEDSIYQVILDRLHWKHLSVEFPCEWKEKDAKNYPPFVLVRKILENYCGELQELSFSNLGNGSKEFIQNVIQGRSFPCLQILKVDRLNASSAFAKALVSCAPNLKKFFITRNMKVMENFLEGSSAELVAASGFDIECDQVCESLISALRTEVISVKHFTSFDPISLSSIIPKLLEATRPTLKTLQMDLLFAVPLMCYGICLENVKNLCICMSNTTVEGLEPQILPLLKFFELTCVFPNLSEVVIEIREEQDFSLDDISAFIERGSVVARKARPDRAINIRHLKLFYGKDCTPLLTLLAQMFPNVKALSVMTEALQEFPFTLLWQHFDCLSELQIEFGECISATTTIMDSIFCGIFPEEVAELRDKNEKYLMAVNIVPVMPSITCMRELRSLIFLDGSRHSNDTNRVPMRIFSEVTGLIGFSRCPTLTVKFGTHSDSTTALQGPMSCAIL